MKFVLQKNRVVASTMGLAIEFEKGVPTFVPPYMYQEVIAVGAIPESELTDDELKTSSPGEIIEPVARKEAILKALEAIALRNIREEFTAGGAPHLAVITKELGWAVPAKERDIAWVEFKVGSDE